MIRSTMLSQARKMANDNDATNPFHSDALLYGILDNWMIDLAMFLAWPRTTQSISFAIGDGGATGHNLNTDILTILRVNWEPASGSSYVILKPMTESELNLKFPDWRSFGNGSPSYYVLQDSVTEQAAAFPLRKITTERPTDTAKTMRIHYIQAPAASTDGTKSPPFPAPLHLTGVYYMAWQMYLPRNKDRADEYMKLYFSERRRIKDQVMRWTQDNDKIEWDTHDGSTVGSLSA